jgi:hypothetical protein
MDLVGAITEAQKREIKIMRKQRRAPRLVRAANQPHGSIPEASYLIRSGVAQPIRPRATPCGSSPTRTEAIRPRSPNMASVPLRLHAATTRIGLTIAA